MREVNGALFPRGWGGVGAQCGLCASALGLRYGEETGAPARRGATPPRLSQLLHRPPVLQPPAQRPGVNRAAPTIFPVHTLGTARPVPQSRGAEVESSRGRMGRHVAPSSGTQLLVLRPESPHPAPGSREPRASASDPVIRAWWLSSARLGRRSRTAGPGESRRRRGRGEPGAPPRLPTERRLCSGAPKCAWGWEPTEAVGLEHECGSAWAAPLSPGTATSPRTRGGPVRCWGRVRDTNATWGARPGPPQRSSGPASPPPPRRPCLSPRGGPSRLSNEVGRTSCSSRSLRLVPRLFK